MKSQIFIELHWGQIRLTLLILTILKNKYFQNQIV